MINIIEDIRAKIAGNLYKNEEHLRFSLVTRLLAELGWDIWNPAEVYPGFPLNHDTGKSSVDLALIASPPSPGIIMKIKVSDSIDGHIMELETLLRDYGGSVDTALFIVTNGNHWRFYYAPEGESITFMPFHTIDFMNDPVEDIVDRFTTYLSRQAISDGSAISAAKDFLFDTVIKGIVAEVLPNAVKLLGKPPYPRLPQAIMELMTSKGYILTEEETIAVLEKIDQQDTAELPQQQVAPTEKNPVIAKNGRINYANKKIKSFDFQDTTYEPESWRDMLLQMCDLLYELHAEDFNKCLTLGDPDHPYFSMNQTDLFGNAPARINDSDYFVMTNFNANDIVVVILGLLELFGHRKSELKIVIE